MASKPAAKPAPKKPAVKKPVSATKRGGDKASNR